MPVMKSSVLAMAAVLSGLAAVATAQDFADTPTCPAEGQCSCNEGQTDYLVSFGKAIIDVGSDSDGNSNCVEHCNPFNLGQDCFSCFLTCEGAIKYENEVPNVNIDLDIVFCDPEVDYLADCFTDPPTPAPVAPPTAAPTAPPTVAPTAPPTAAPTAPPTAAPTAPPTAAPTAPPTAAPTAPPTAAPTAPPTAAPTAPPTAAPTAPPTAAPTAPPTAAPTAPPTEAPVAPCCAALTAEQAAALEAECQTVVCNLDCDSSDPTCGYAGLGENCQLIDDVANTSCTDAPTPPPTAAPTVAPTVPPTMAPTPPPTEAPVAPCCGALTAEQAAALEAECQTVVCNLDCDSSDPTCGYAGLGENCQLIDDVANTSCTDAPTPPPTMAPTMAPVAPPTMAPTMAPVAPPTMAPVAPVTEAPVAPITVSPIAQDSTTCTTPPLCTGTAADMAYLELYSKCMVVDARCSLGDDNVPSHCNAFGIALNCRSCFQNCEGAIKYMEGHPGAPEDEYYFCPSSSGSYASCIGGEGGEGSGTGGDAGSSGCECDGFGESCYVDDTCVDGLLGCNVKGLPNCRFCGFGAYVSIACP